MRQLIRGTPRGSSGGHSDAPHRAFTPARVRSRSQTQHGLPRAPRARRRADAPVGNGRRGEHMHARQGPPRCGSRRRADARSSRRNQRSSRGHQRSSEVIRGHQRSLEVIRGHQRSSEVIRGHQRSSDARSSRRSRSTNEACHQAGGAAPASCPAADAAGCQSCRSAVRSSWSALQAKGSSSRVWRLATPWAGRPGVGAIRCNQVQIGAIRCNQVQIGAIRCNQANLA